MVQCFIFALQLSFIAHAARITAICVDVAKGMIITGAQDKLVRVMDMQTKTMTTGPIRDAWITSMTYVP